jgi:hypothetical protein
MALLQTQSQAIGLGNTELTFNILEGLVKCLGPIYNIVDDNPCVDVDA